MIAKGLEIYYEKSYRYWTMKKENGISNIHILYKSNERIVFHICTGIDVACISYYDHFFQPKPKIVNRVFLVTARDYWKQHKEQSYRIVK